MAELFGVTKQVLTNWRSRKAGFPEPIADLKSGPVWNYDAVRAWAELTGVDLMETPNDDVAEEAPRGEAVVAAFMNMKGGVGKSTLTANLGWYAAHQRNLKTLLVDLDPQFNLTQYILGLDGVERLLTSNAPTVDRIFQSGPGRDSVEVQDVIKEIHNWQDGSCLHLLPAKLDLAWTIRTAPNSANLLRDNLQDIKGDYDLIMIDCAPTDSVLSDAAYMAADYIFVPVRPEFLSYIGLPLLLESMDRFHKAHRTLTLPKFGGIIFNDTGDNAEHARARRHVRDVADQNNLYVFKSEISHSSSYAVGSRTGKPIFMTDYARSWKKTEFNRVASEFIQRMGL